MTTADVAIFGVDTTWTMVAGILVMFMHAGFAMLEAGTVQAKNTQSILMKNLLIGCVSSICWWLFGFGIAFGEDKDKFIGTNLFVAQNKDFMLQDGTLQYVSWFFQWAFCATGGTIVSGAVAERVQLPGFCLFSIVMTTLIYPVVVHWTWGGGWLSEADGDKGLYTDFAGSGIVHLCGGVAALCGAAVIGARAGRWESTWDPEPNSIPLVVLGTFILWFGWYGFNCGSTVSMTGDGNANANTAALVAMTTTLAAGTGGLVTFYIRLAMTRQYDLGGLTNGILAGLVSITAGCDGVYGWAAIVIGFIGAWVYCGSSALVKMLKIDDPLDAFSVHGSCGVWGVIAVALFNAEKGIFYGGEGAGKLLGWQLCGIITIALWTAGLSLPTFLALRLLGILRMSKEDEDVGGDAHCVSPRPSKREMEI